MEKRTVIQWKDTGNVVDVLMCVRKYEPDSYTDPEEHIFYYIDPEKYKVGYTDGEWTILEIADELSVEPKWHLTRPTVELNNEEVVVGVDHCDVRADFRLGVIQFVELYNGTVEPFYHITDKQAMCYSVAAKEILSTSSYSDIAIPGGWGATIVWLPIHHVK